MDEAKKNNEVITKYNNSTLLRMITNLIPYIGGSIDVALSEKWNKIQYSRLETIIQNLEKSLAEIKEDHINKEFINSDEFVDLIMICFKIGSRSRYEEKLKILSNVIRQSVTEVNFDLDKFEEISWFIDNLTLKELKTLLVLEKWEFIEDDQPGRVEEIEKDKYSTVWDQVEEEIKENSKIETSEELELILEVLKQKGLFQYSSNFVAVHPKHIYLYESKQKEILSKRDYMKGRVSTLYFKIRNYLNTDKI